MVNIVSRSSNGAGYLLNDNRNSGGKKQEDDIYSCAHCQALLLKSQYVQDGGFCSRCMQPVCPHCADRMLTFGCENFLRQLEVSLGIKYREDQFRKMAGIEAGAPREGTKIIVGGLG